MAAVYDKNKANNESLSDLIIRRPDTEDHETESASFIESLTGEDFSYEINPEDKNSKSGEVRIITGTPPVSSVESKDPIIDNRSVEFEKGANTATMEKTLNYFEKRIPYLSDTLSKSPFYYSERILDESTGTCVYILAKNNNYASNLNGYFYYLFDKKNSSNIISPLVLNISALFEEEDRQKVYENKSYAGDLQKQALNESLKAVLGDYYTTEIFKFIFEGYKETFNRRVTGENPGTKRYKATYKDLEVIFHDSFITYVEFYINN